MSKMGSQTATVVFFSKESARVTIVFYFQLMILIIIISIRCIDIFMNTLKK